MTKDKASVYVDAQSLYELLYDIQFRVPKRERVCIMPRIFDHCEGIIKYFDLAYHTSDKLKYIELMMGEFATLKVLLRILVVKRIVNNQGLETLINEHIAKLQIGIDKWYSFVVSARQD